MSGPDQKPNTPDDRELEEFLSGSGVVREAYRASAHEKSPASVDDVILGMAARAAAESKAPVRKPRALRRWPTAIATAAVLLLSLSVFVEIHRDPVAEKAALAPMIMEAAPAPPVAVPEASPKPGEVEQKLWADVRTYEEKAQRNRSARKKEMAKADANDALARMHAPADPMRPSGIVAQPAPEVESSALAKAEPAMGDDVSKDAQDSTAPSMAAKSLRAAPTERRVAAAPAPASVEASSGGSAFDQQIDHWLRTCADDSGPTLLPTDGKGRFKDLQQWRELPVTGFVGGALQFAPEVSREAIVAQLNQIDPHAAACLGTSASGNALQLRCGCAGH